MHPLLGKTKLILTFSTIDRMLHRVPAKYYLNCSCTEDLCNNFADFFHRKIETIRHKLDTLPRPDTSEFERLENTELTRELYDLSPTSEEELSGIVKKFLSKSCYLDPVPSSLLSYCTEYLLPVIFTIVKPLLAGVNIGVSMIIS